MLITVFDEPAERSPSLIVSPGLSGIGEADSSADGDAAGEPAGDAAGEAAGDAAGDPAGALIAAVQSPGMRLAGIGSVTPAATTPTVTAVWLLPRSVRIPPPVMLLLLTASNVMNFWFRPEAAGEPAGPDSGGETGGYTAPGGPVAPATPSDGLVVLLPHAATISAVATRPANANRGLRDMAVLLIVLGRWKRRLTRAKRDRGGQAPAARRYSSAPKRRGVSA